MKNNESPISVSGPAELATRFINTTDRNIFLTGKAGTGKTTFLKNILSHTFKNTAIVAPTGIAAINAGGVTIHSMFQLPAGIFIPSEFSANNTASSLQIIPVRQLTRQQHFSKTKRKVLQELELLIIDEVSMLRADITDAIDSVLKSVRKNHTMPFGGVQVLFIGDLFQLPPVVRENEKTFYNRYYKTPFFFDAKVFRNDPPVYIELDKIHRQTDETFIRVLNNFRNNNVTADDLEVLNKRCMTETEINRLSDYIRLTTHNHRADTINKDMLRKLKSETVTFKAVVKGEFPESAYPNDMELEIKKGAQVMFIKNDSSGKPLFYNGKIGSITSISNNEIQVICPEDEQEITVKKQVWKNIRYTTDPATGEITDEEIGTFEQFPLRLAWAITIHKSQGLTFSKAIIDLENAFAPGQIYVALSRMRNPEGLVLSGRINMNSLHTENAVSEFSRTGLSEDQLNFELDRDSDAYLVSYATNAFRLESLFRRADEFAKDDGEEESHSIRNRHSHWAKLLVNDIAELKITAGKFIAQMHKISNDRKLFCRRIHAAEEYFTPKLEEILNRISAHRVSISSEKRSKLYRESLVPLEEIFADQLCRFKKAVALTSALVSGKVPQRSEMFISVKAHDRINHEENKPARNERVSSSVKRKPGESRTLSLTMYRSGQSIAQIAEARKMIASTIESHLAECVEEGLLSATEFLTEEKLEKILSASVRLGTRKLRDLKDHLGDDFTWADLRIGIAQNKKLKDSAA